MTKIICFSGKKQAGKNTSANFLFGLNMWSILDEDGLPLVDYFKVDDKGRLIIPVDFGPERGGVQDGIFDPTSQEPAVQTFLASKVWDVVKIYSFADSLKEVCMHVLGLTAEQCFGNNEAKNQPTHLIWKNMPGFPTGKTAFEKLGRLGFQLEEGWTPDSHMTARHVLQFVGTEVFRKMYHNVWVDATIRKIKAESPKIALIADCRFPNEVMGIKEAGGTVVRLTRAPFEGQDEHASETSLNPDKFD